jgi:hypothetical protein
MPITALPYLILPICLPGIEGDDDKIVDGKFWPTNIGAYHESYSGTRTLIYGNGQPFLIQLTIPEYEDKIKQYFELINKPAEPARILSGRELRKANTDPIRKLN